MYLRCLLFVAIVIAVNASKRRYDEKMVASVWPSEETHYKLLEHLENISEIDIWNEIVRNSSVHVMFDKFKFPQLFQLFQQMSMKPTVLINDVQKAIDQEERSMMLQARNGARGIRDTFHNYDDLTAWLKNIAAAYPSLATLQSIGKTYENRDIWLIKLTANSGVAKKTALMDFGIHAREWISPATGAYMIDEFLSTYATNANAKRILDTWELHIIPVFNPDGYAHSHRSDRMWRKNRKVVGSCIGVDLNRNFGYQWNTGGSSASACSDTFHGGAPMTENEAKALQAYMTGRQWTTYLTFHSYGQWFFTNWGYTTADPPNYALLKQKAQIATNAIRSVNGRAYTVGSSAQILYIASGGSEDWTRGALNILYSYCIELPPTGGSGFIAPVSEIKKTGAETYVGIVAYLNSF